MNNNNIIIKIDNNTQNTSNDDFNYDRFTQEDKNNKITIENNCISKNIDIQKVENKKKQLFSFKNNIKFGKIIKSILRDGFFKFFRGKPIFFKSFILLPCGHFFHSNCLENWLGVRKECPICRRPISQYI